MFIHSSITPATITEAAEAGIAGVKLYPQGVTTNSDAGVSELTAFYPVFAAMEEHDLVLNLHGEVHSHPSSSAISAEEAFLPTLQDLHTRFPNLRIVLEHCSTAAAIAAVRACGDSVAGTITAHHLYSTVEDTHDPLAFCKPIPKRTSDRDALLRAAVSGDGRFFFGSDSAPHPLSSKLTAIGSSLAPAGVFTQPFATQLVLLALDEAVQRQTIINEEVTHERFEQFLSGNGRRYYKLPEPTEKTTIVLEQKPGEKIPKSIKSEDGEVEVGISRWGSEVRSLRWVESKA